MFCVSNEKSLVHLSIVSIVAIVSLTICFLSTKGYDTTLSVENEKIEVTANNSNLQK